MKPSIPFPAGAVVASFVSLFLLPAHASAQSDPELGATPDAAAILAADFAVGDVHARVHYDEPGDGALWARGPRWKASFDVTGATYFAGFGARQPRSLPHALSPDLVTVGGESLEFEREPKHVLRGDRVEFDRGAFVEAYELAPESIEQLFFFESLPRTGDLVVRIPVASELDGVDTDAGLEFRGEHGRVTYSRAVAIDARGARSSAETRLVNGTITIRVEAEFLASAEFPLVVDPVIAQIWLDSSTTDFFAPDMAWDPFHQVWVAVYAETFSATDTDVFARMMNASGATLATAYVDLSTSSWTRPRIANNGGAHAFLVVAERTSSTPKSVMGRMCRPNGTLLVVDPQIDIGGTAAGDKRTPDVGGDPRSIAGTHFCVVLEHVVAAGDTEIAYRLVTATGTPVNSGPWYLTDPAAQTNVTPTISRSNGGSTWLVGWSRTIAFPLSTFIMGARLQWDGVILSPPFAVSGGTNVIAANPCASSPLAGSQVAAIAFSTRSLFPSASPADVVVSVFDGATPVQAVNLMTLEASSTQAQNQIEPSIESDGQHFLVSYSEFNAAFGHYEMFVSDLFLAGNQLGLSQTHLEPHAGLGLSQRISQIAAKPALSGESHRYAIIYEIRANDQNHDISFVLVDGLEGGTTSNFCFGDGTGTACPCGNSGGIGRGCANSVNASGGLLLASGTPSTVDDTLALQASGLPNSSTCLFFQGTAQTAAAVFGDGLRCVGGTTIRLATKTAPTGSAQYPAPSSGDAPVSIRGAVPVGGGQRTYQVWYRNSAAFCTTSTFNLTSGVVVNWAR